MFFQAFRVSCKTKQELAEIKKHIGILVFDGIWK